MADITMCVGTDCPLRETCYRYTATPNEHWQSFTDFTPKLETVLSWSDDTRAYCPEHVPNAI